LQKAKKVPSHKKHRKKTPLRKKRAQTRETIKGWEATLILKIHVPKKKKGPQECQKSKRRSKWRGRDTGVGRKNFEVE